MSLDLVLAVSSIYVVLVGLGLIISPAALSGSATFSPVYAADFFRAFGGTLVAIGVLNWMARGAGPSKARTAIVWSNIVGFLLTGLFTIFGILNGYPALGWVMVVIDALVVVGFLMTGMSGESAPTMAAPKPVPAAAAAASTMVAPAKKTTKTAAKKATKKSARRR